MPSWGFPGTLARCRTGQAGCGSTARQRVPPCSPLPTSHMRYASMGGRGRQHQRGASFVEADASPGEGGICVLNRSRRSRVFSKLHLLDRPRGGIRRSADRHPWAVCGCPGRPGRPTRPNRWRVPGAAARTDGDERVRQRVCGRAQAGHGCTGPGRGPGIQPGPSGLCQTNAGTSRVYTHRVRLEATLTKMRCALAPAGVPRPPIDAPPRSFEHLACHGAGGIAFLRPRINAKPGGGS